MDSVVIDVAALLEYAQASTWEATYPKLSRACPKRGIPLLVLGIAGFQPVPADASVLFGHWRLGGEQPRCFQAGEQQMEVDHPGVGLPAGDRAREVVPRAHIVR